MGIEKAAVIGAGVMGAGIAAHLANAGLPVLLLDVVPKEGDNRNALAEGAVARMLKADPEPFMQRSAAKRITAGNLEDDLDSLSEADWIIEAVLEDPAIKRSLFERIEAVRKEGSIVSSNTSTLPRHALVEGLPARFDRDFLITHFFNPPRYMRLLEIVTGPNMRADAADIISDFADQHLGKTVVPCNDTPGFIANRIGTFWIQCAIVEAVDHGLSVEEADAVMGRPVGIPKTGIFGLLDLVGIDLMPHVDRNLAAALPPEDAYQKIRHELPFIAEMIQSGYTGRKGKGGFYRLNTDGGKRLKEARDLKTGEYAPAQRAVLDSLMFAKSGGLQSLVEHGDKGGGYAWAVLSQTLRYAAALVPEIADDVAAVDAAMRYGYAWKYGPFELIDRLGAAYLSDRLKKEGKDVPPLLAKAAESGGFYRVHDGKKQYLTTAGTYEDIRRPSGVLLLEDIKLASEPLARNGSASLWDIGDGVACFEIHTKLNTIDPDVLALLGKSIKTVGKDFKALVVYNEGSHFSAGANLGFALFAANTALWPMIEDMVEQGQKVYSQLKAAPFPVVAAPSGLALGGGCEILLHSDAVQAHAESYVGLVEAGVGVIPGWGGCKELLARLGEDPKRPKGPIPPVATAFETIGLAKVAKSAFQAQELGYMRGSDAITFNRDRLLADAKAKALALVDAYQPPEPIELTLPGPTGKAALGLALHDLHQKGVATDHDMIVADALSDVLTGGESADITEPVLEKDILALERRSFMRLIHTEPTLARIAHTLETGKPLRN